MKRAITAAAILVAGIAIAQDVPGEIGMAVHAIDTAFLPGSGRNRGEPSVRVAAMTRVGSPLFREPSHRRLSVAFGSTTLPNPT